MSKAELEKKLVSLNKQFMSEIENKSYKRMFRQLCVDMNVVIVNAFKSKELHKKNKWDFEGE